MNKKEFVSELAEKTGLNNQQAGRALDAVTAIIMEKLQEGEQVSFYGFVSMKLVKPEPRKIFNPWKRETAMVQPRPKLQTRLSTRFLKALASDEDFQLPEMEEPTATTAEAAPPTEAAPEVAPTTTASPQEDKTGHLDETLPWVRRSRVIARVMVKDVLLYHNDLVEQVKNGADREETLGEILDVARRTLNERIGKELPADVDFIGEAFDQQIQGS